MRTITQEEYEWLKSTREYPLGWECPDCGGGFSATSADCLTCDGKGRVWVKWEKKP